MPEPQETLSVSQLNTAVKKCLEMAFPFIWVEGEISNFKLYPSGHMYFSLKDDKAQVRCVMFAGSNRYLNFLPENGKLVKMKAKVSLYADRGDFQLIADFMEESGDGALQRAFEFLKKKLSLEGLFDAALKKPLPKLPRTIGIVTSPRGAAIRDIITTLKRRFPSIAVIIYPALVQGHNASVEIAQAISTADRRKECDVLIVGRGGGSLEDLQAFNEEIVARAIFACKIPIVSAVGHEVDITIADFVCDVRAATPTAAAELISPHQDDLIENILRLEDKLITAIELQLEKLTEKIIRLLLRLKDPQTKLNEMMQRLDYLQKTLAQHITHELQHWKNHANTLIQQLAQHSPLHRINQYAHLLKLNEQNLHNHMHTTLQAKKYLLANLAQLMDTLSPLQTLSRGYAIVKNERGQLIKKMADIHLGDTLNTQLANGFFSSTVTQKQETR